MTLIFTIVAVVWVYIHKSEELDTYYTFSFVTILIGHAYFKKKGELPLFIVLNFVLGNHLLLTIICCYTALFQLLITFLYCKQMEDGQDLELVQPCVPNYIID